MRNLVALLLLMFFLIPEVLCQEIDKIRTNVSPSLSYVSENDRGNIGFGIGIKTDKAISNTIAWELGLTYFNTELIDINQASRAFDTEDDHFRSLLLTPSLSYRFIGSHDTRVSSSVRLGPSLQFYDYKDFESGLLRYYSDGRIEPAPGAVIRYNEQQGVMIMLFAGIGIEGTISNKLKAGVFLDTYSSGSTPLQFLVSGIGLSFRL